MSDTEAIEWCRQNGASITFPLMIEEGTGMRRKVVRVSSPAGTKRIHAIAWNLHECVEDLKWQYAERRRTRVTKA